MGRVVLGHDQAAARFLVQTMHDPGPFFSADPGKVLAMGQEGVDQGMLLMSGAGMHDQTGRFVQDQQIVVLEQDFEGDRFRLRFDLLELGLGQFHGVAGTDRIAGPGNFAVEFNELFSNQGLEAGPGKGGERQGEKAVEARTGVFFFDLEFDHGRRWIARSGAR